MKLAEENRGLFTNFDNSREDISNRVGLKSVHYKVALSTRRFVSIDFNEFCSTFAVVLSISFQHNVS